ncbi:hypothetical protein R3X25_09545 [Lutibacter sp. TH_r2]|uniref:tetratricopeptide repeat protein n=1 Tax=Lutibacter sp. TH_r2 TaxID=3082083 RepID=UPI002954497D|nr:hypothetical protein [Lutibacter sp. TH_r2]MDV7187523.1 hypothetical protein [Lutibacter sp. TH_r2]
MKNFIYIATFLITFVAVSQSTTVAFEKSKLTLAKKYSDQSSAISSIYNIIALEGPTSTYLDTLAVMYFNSRKNISCFLVIEDILKSKPNDQRLLEMKAISLESMGALEKAIETYQTILKLSNSNYHAYKISGLQLALNKFDEAYASAKKADQLTDSGKYEVTFQVNKNYNQKVKLKPAIAYLLGMIEVAMKKNEDAKLSFERAVSLFPDFVLAKSKLTTLEAQ